MFCFPGTPVWAGSDPFFGVVWESEGYVTYASKNVPVVVRSVDPRLARHERARLRRNLCEHESKHNFPSAELPPCVGGKEGTGVLGRFCCGFWRRQGKGEAEETHCLVSRRVSERLSWEDLQSLVLGRVCKVVVGRVCKVAFETACSVNWNQAILALFLYQVLF